MGVVPLAVKPPRCEADHSPPSSADVKNQWNYASTLLHASLACTDNFTFTWGIRSSGMSRSVNILRARRLRYAAADARNQAPLLSTFAYAIWRFKNTLTMRVKWRGAPARWKEAPCNNWPGISCNSGMKTYCKNGDEKLIITHLLFVLLIKVIQFYFWHINFGTFCTTIRLGYDLSSSDERVRALTHSTR